MTIIHPLLASRSAPNYRQSWRLAGVWRRAINLMTESGELLTLHRQGSGFGPGGWVLRRAQFDALCGGLCGNERPQVVAQGIRLGRFTVKQPQRYCLLRITPPAHPQPLAVAWMQRAEETGLFGPLVLAASDPLPAELRQFRHCFQAALNGVKTDWRHWLGKGPGLTPSHDDTLSGMLLAAWYYGALDARSGRQFFRLFRQSSTRYHCGERQLFTLCRARIFRLATPALCSCSELSETYRSGDRFAAGAGAYVRGRYAAGVLAWSTIITRETMKTLVVALGGNALLQRGEALTAKNQYRNIASAVPALARLARSYRLAIVHGNGPQVGLLALQNLAWKEVEPYPLDVLVAESQGMIGYMLAQSLSAQPQMPPVTTVLTRIEVSPDDPAFLQPEKFIGPVYQPEEQEALEAAYGWQMKRDGKYLRRVVASPQPRKILDSEAIELLLKEGHVVICSGGGGVPVTEDGAGSEAVIDKDLAAALLAEQINADGLVILTDADAVYENWGTPQQRAIRHATPDELAPFAKADGSMGPKVTAVSGYVRSRGKPAWIGALSRIEETLAGEAGTCISL